MILVIDDNREFATVLSRELKRRGHEVRTAHSGADGLALVGESAPDLIFLDVRLPDMSGIDVLKEVRASRPDVEVVMITGYPDVRSAIAGIEGGVKGYLEKPFNFGDLDDLLQRVLPRGVPAGLRRAARSIARKTALETDLVGASPATEGLRALIQQLAATGFRACLITGESGTGKDLVARLLHTGGSRREGPFVAVNSSAVGETLFESEFFGHERGAFTGAVGARRGLVEIAHGGTLFLDEIGEMPRSLQAKLLRFLDDQSFRRVGGERIIRVDVQLVAATNRDLPVMIAEGGFREDLYFRLNVAPLRVRPLRERPEDIVPLAEHFLREANARSGKQVRSFAPGAREILLGYPWPGNVRELRNLVERLVIFCPDAEIREIQFPAEYVEAAHGGDPARPGSASPSIARGVGAGHPGASDEAPPAPLVSLEDMERVYIRKVLSQVAGNKTKAAEILGISRQTLRSKLGPTD